MVATNFNTSNQTLRKLMGNGLSYRVPPFQRDYSWTEQEWEELWQDIVAMTEPGGEDSHYMGYLVLQSSDERHYDIIDGQQRITTLSLLVLAVLKTLQRFANDGIDPEGNKSRLDALRKTYIGYLDPVTLLTTSKLTLNRHNNRFYQTYLVTLERPPKRNLKASEHQLRKGFDWFAERIYQRFVDSRIGADLARFVDAVADGLFFTVISVTDELNAFKVFETLNARGVRLSSTDLLKNYLFSVVDSAGEHERELAALEDRWEAIVDSLRSEKVPEFLRVSWNSRNPLTREAELFKTVRDKIRDKGAVFDLLRDMERDADIYGALNDPSSGDWDANQLRHIENLTMFGMRQPLPLLLSAYRAFDANEFSRILRACVIISFRYNVICNLTPSEQEAAYHAAARKIASGQFKNALETIRSLRSIYPSDKAFCAAFAEKEIRTTSPRSRKIVRWALFAIEAHISNTEFDFLSNRYNVEHILPEHPGDAWTSFTDDQIERLRYRLGNMTVLSASANRDIGNASYLDKRAVFEQSEFEITKRIAAEHEEWTPERINSRQMWLANQAVAVWRLPEMDSS